MIKSFRHAGLKALHEGTTTRRVAPERVEKLRDILALLEQGRRPQDMSLPGLGLHPLKGARRGEWAVKVSGNWRVTFRFEDGHAIRVDYEDYH